MITDEQAPVASGEGGEQGEETVSLTPKAVEMVKELLARENRSGQGLRVWVNTGGCSGLSYGLDFAPSPSEGDLTLDLEGVSVFIDRHALPYLKGTVIDYVTGLHRAGFRFINPRASRTCGCGESFSV